MSQSISFDDSYWWVCVHLTDWLLRATCSGDQKFLYPLVFFPSSCVLKLQPTSSTFLTKKNMWVAGWRRYYTASMLKLNAQTETQYQGWSLFFKSIIAMNLSLHLKEFTQWMLTFVSLLCPPVENKHVLCHYANNPAFGMKKKIQKEGGKKNNVW